MPDFTNRKHKTVQPHEIETGDIIVGTHHHVDTTIFDGNDGRWHFYDVTGNEISTATLEARIAVWRDTSGRYLDWCDARGIDRS